MATRLLALLLFAPALAWGQDVRVQASVEETTVGVEEMVVYALEISGGDFSEVGTPSPPVTEGLALAQPYPSTQRSVSIVNGQTSQSLVFRWTFRPIRQGRARFAPLEVRVGGRTYRTEEIRLNVVAQTQRPQRSAPRGSGGAGWPFGGAPDPPPDRAQSQIDPSDLFIRAFPSKTNAYQNEQVTVEYKLFFRPGVQFRQIRLADSWDATGFWREELEVDSRPIPEPVVLDGVRYQSIVLKRVAVFATRSGNLSVDPLKIETEVLIPERSRDPFGFFGSFGRYQIASITSSPVRINAQPLPAGAPNDFAGAVGSFRMTGGYDRTSLEVGEALNLNLVIRGEGNLATLDPPRLSAPGAFEVYDPRVTSDIDRSGTRVRGSKTMQYVLLPRTNGSYALPAVTFSYFDPSTRRYETLRTEAATIRVTGTAAPVASDALTLPAEGIAGLMTDSGSWTRTDRVPLHRQPLPYAALGLPLLGLAALALVRRRSRYLEQNPALVRSQRAHPMAKRYLREARAHFERDDARAFYEALDRALLGYLGSRFHFEERGLTRPALDARLAEAGVPDAARAHLRHLLERCDQARFAPVAPDHAAQREDLDSASALIAEMESSARQPTSTTA